MEKAYSILNAEGKLLYARYDIKNIAEGEIAVEELITEVMENPYFNFETRTFYDRTNE